MNTVAVTSAANTQIVDVYESGVPIDAIASEFAYEIDAVKLILLQCSLKYRREVTGIVNDNLGISESFETPSDTFTADDELMAKNAIKSLSRDSEMDNVRLKASIYIVDDRKGRNDAVLKGLAKAGGVGGFNITVVNNHFKEMRAAMARAKDRNRTVTLEAVAA